MRSTGCTWLHSTNARTYETRSRVRNAQMGMPVQTSRGWAQWYKHEWDFSMAGSVARKRELCPISIAAPGAAPLVYHVFIVEAWLPGRTRNVNLHFLASYAVRSRDQYGRTQGIRGAINGIDRSEDRSSRVYFVLRFSRKRRARDVSRSAASDVFTSVPLVSNIVINTGTRIGN